MCPREENEIVHVDCVTHRYPDGTEGIHNMCFRVFPKEIVALCGANGAGKSTLVEHINGLMLPDVGRVRVFGLDIGKGNVSTVRKMVGLVFQDADSQLFSPTVLDDVMFGPLNLGLSPDEARKRAEWALGVVGIREVNKIPHYLSGGQKRLVAIAGVLAMSPKILVADEPTGDLDATNAKMIEDLLRSLRDEHGMSVVVTLHDLDMAGRLADRVCVVKDGSILAEGPPREVLYNEELLRSAGLQLPTVARILRDLGIEAPTESRPLSIEELMKHIGPKKKAEKSRGKGV
ncbi:MAG: cobalt ABC transporter [Euryarchaeota archaeon RBG_16_62_10]|nr:MAG: cobalt ABC transporter [Euryarchaeota archaeon RBG_16_62_10]